MVPHVFYEQWKKDRKVVADERKVFYMYDEIMMRHEDYDGHPECPLRIKSIHDYLKEVGLLD